MPLRNTSFASPSIKPAIHRVIKNINIRSGNLFFMVWLFSAAPRLRSYSYAYCGLVGNFVNNYIIDILCCCYCHLSFLSFPVPNEFYGPGC